MKKNILFIFLVLLIHNFSIAQSLTITPNSATNSEVLKINKIGIGLDHRTTNGIVGVGTYVNSSFGILQTHTNHSLGFATNNGAIQAYLGTNGNFGLGGITNPQYFLDVNGRGRIRHNGNTAGIWFSKTTNAVDEGSFFGNINDNSAGIWIGNAWRFGVNDAGTVLIPSLAGSGTRPVGADASGNLVPLPTGSSIAFSVGITSNELVLGTGAESQIDLGYEFYDLGNNFSTLSNYQFEVPATGVYHCTINVPWEGNANGYRDVILRNQSTVYIRAFRSYPPNNQVFIQNFSADLYLTQGSRVLLYASQTSGVNLNIFPAYYTLVLEPILSCYKVN